ncbi:DUF2264 domain-containing protein [Plantactinospora sp. KLBMP9567]|uniref:DUF2264 domain-containing protein n=1 Tax=Plantactinospora sp. KLBMP9567 TaxID=3085900 RepID=UPI0029812E82|nr:DUF2264 domain-containing protein [Plantactinospora sp. KLBMP9567]MDW5324823.1 DUF2264 domain-containing protein [Plantactinospora sp. KLBMP9567]
MSKVRSGPRPGPPAPGEDRRLSPYTGWSRAHWEWTVDRMLAAVRPYASPGHALIELPGPVSSSGRRSDGLEGFARTFLAAGFRLAHGTDGGLAQWYAEGLAAGVDPDSPERWPRVTEVNQAKVEAASIALALHESRHVLWDSLDDRVRDRVVGWLAEVIGQPYPACNWWWFQNVVEAFLRSVGGPWSAEEIERNIAGMERWYLGDGWYTDGLEGAGTARNFDWYAGWAMNFYPLWYCRISGEHAGAELWSRYRERLHAYLTGAQHLYAPDGAPLHQGRSLTYRYAALAPVWAGAVFEATPLPPGRTRRLASGVLRHFQPGSGRPDGGPGQPEGFQPIGWYGAFPAIRQPYTGPGSPYWSSKGFTGLVLPPGHPVWTAREQALAVEERDVTFALPVPGWLVSGTTADGVVRVVNHGTDHAADETLGTDEPGYSRYAYATHAGPEYDGSVLDNCVTLVDPAGEPAHRRPLRPFGVRGRTGSSAYRTHWPVGPAPERVWPPRQPAFRTGPWLYTASVLRGAVEIRLARVGTVPDGAGPWTLRIGGYTLAGEMPPEVLVRSSGATARRPDGLTSTVRGLRGLPVAGVVERAGANAFGGHSAVPFVQTAGPVRPAEVYAAAVLLTGATPPELPEVTVGPGGAVELRWPDGERDELTLDAPSLDD